MRISVSRVWMCAALAAAVVAASASDAQAQYRPPSGPVVGEDYHIEASYGWWNPEPSLVVNSSALGIVGSDIAHAVPLTLVAGLGHATTGAVDWTLLGSLLVGSLPGIWLGSHVAYRLPERAVRGLLATLLVLIGGKLAL